MFNVLIEIEKPPFALKAGMTGYAKISAGFQPLGLLLARPTTAVYSNRALVMAAVKLKEDRQKGILCQHQTASC